MRIKPLNIKLQGVQGVVHFLPVLIQGLWGFALVAGWWIGLRPSPTGLELALTLQFHKLSRQHFLLPLTLEPVRSC